MIGWVDVETTGLDPLGGVILEVALVITTDDLMQIDSKHVVVRQSEHIRNIADDYVQKMHDKSRLWDAVTHPTAMLLEDAERSLIETIAPYDQIPMGGSSVTFDRKWLEWHMPAFAGAFHYRSIDVSTVKEMVARWCPQHMVLQRGEAAHRAMDDIQTSIADARTFRKEIFLPAKGGLIG